MNLLIAIPALNESESIRNVIREIHEFIPQATVLVVDDGSTDDTAKIAKQSGAQVISLPFNLGVGGALRVAFRYATENRFSHVMQIDADGQHLPSEAKQLIENSSDNSVVIGSRFFDSESQYKASLARRTAMISLAKITSAICGTKLTDVTSGFRITSGDAVQLFARSYPREYLGDTVESLIIAHRAGITIKEVPVSMKKREAGAPSQNFLKSVWYLIRAWMMIILAIFRKN